MTPLRVEDLVRNFPENGMKLLLQRPRNVRDLLRIRRFRHVDLIDFDRLQLDPTTYVQRDYRHVESDLVLRGPLLRGRGHILIYILLELQSEPDRLMPFRALEYVTAILRGQLREWGQTNSSTANFLFQPVLPVVLYTGTRPWPRLPQLKELFAGGEALAELAPSHKPLFINLRNTPERRLVSDGGPFGQVLRLVQQRHTRRAAFRALLEEVVRELEQLPRQEKQRWSDLLSYVFALVYHQREEQEHGDLQARIEQSVQSDEHRQEVRKMGKSMAEVLIERGRNEARLETLRKTLLLQLRLRFGEPPADVAATVQSCADDAKLEGWIARFVTARRLSDVGIEARD